MTNKQKAIIWFGITILSFGIIYYNDESRSLDLRDLLQLCIVEGSLQAFLHYWLIPHKT